MNIILHQTHHLLASFNPIFDYLDSLKDSMGKSSEATLHIFPELFLTGYPLQDLCLQRPFIKSYQRLLKRIDAMSTSLPTPPHETALLLGGLLYEVDQTNPELRKIKNVVYLLRPGKKLEVLATKQLLPYYDIFDEKKYFYPGSETTIWDFAGKKMAITICEDIWPLTSPLTERQVEHPLDKLKESLKKNNERLDLVVNLSGSPYNLGKIQMRHSLGKKIADFFGIPFIYVNRVGGEDEILFDGRSFICNHEKVIKEGAPFKNTQISITDQELFSQETSTPRTQVENEHLDFAEFFHNSKTRMAKSLIQKSSKKKPLLLQLSDDQCAELIEAMTFGLQEYAYKNNFKKFLVALSGGIDSCVVLSVIKKGLLPDQTVEAIYMPGRYSSKLSLDISEKLCQNLGVKLYHLPIKFIHSVAGKAYEESFKNNLEGLADENIQARLRAVFLFARANQENSLVINTSNKSELAVGYSTLYGDGVGALSLLGDLYKSYVYQLANYINKDENPPLPPEVITRAPTAELKENQADQDSLPPYDQLDLILVGILSYHFDKKLLMKLGFSEKDIDRVFKLYTLSEYKRNQFCPIIKLMPKSFGFGYRNPICKDSIFYLDAE